MFWALIEESQIINSISVVKNENKVKKWGSEQFETKILNDSNPEFLDFWLSTIFWKSKKLKFFFFENQREKKKRENTILLNECNP